MGAYKKTLLCCFLIFDSTLFITSNALSRVLFKGGFEDSTKWLENFNTFRPTPWTEGLNRAKVVFDKDRNKNVLEVSYPKEKFGNDDSGTQWKTYFDKGYEHLTVSYRLKFGENFDFVKGGKLPGLVGGHRTGHPDSVLSGGLKPNGLDGWSARMMWRRNGKIVQYIYHPDQPGNYGQDFEWKVKSKNVFFKSGLWYHVKTEILLNSPKVRNGIVRSWLNNKLALELTNIRFRDIPEIKIDALYFSTFFGGDDDTWSATKDETIRFDKFVIDAY